MARVVPLSPVGAAEACAVAGCGTIHCQSNSLTASSGILVSSANEEEFEYRTLMIFKARSCTVTAPTFLFVVKRFLSEFFATRY